jgi:WD40 repeat protein
MEQVNGVWRTKNYSVGLWEVSTGNQLRRLTGPTEGFSSVALSPDGHFGLAASGDNVVRMWDFGGGPLIIRPRPAAGEVRRMQDDQQMQWSLDFSGDGRRAIGAAGGSAYVWDVGTGRLTRRLSGPPDQVKSVALFPDGRRAVLGGDGSLRTWDTETAQPLRQFDGHTASVCCIAVSRDGRRIVSGAGDVQLEGGKPVTREGRPVYKDCSARVWDPETGEELRRFAGHTLPVWQVSLSADYQRALSRSATELCLWDVGTGKEIRRLGGGGMLAQQVRAAVLMPDGKQAILGMDDGARLWDVETDREVRRFDAATGRVSCLAVTRDGRLLISGSERYPNNQLPVTECTVRLWDVATGKQLHRFDGHTNVLQSVAVSPDGRLALSSSSDKTVRLWDLSVAGKVTEVKPPAARKLPLPDDAAQAKAEGDIKQIYKDDYAKKPSERDPLAWKLLDKARQTKDDMAGRYVLLREARDVAAAAADAASALQAAELMAQQYEVGDVVDFKLAALTATEKAVTTPVANKVLAEAAFVTLDEAVAADNYDAVLKLATLAEECARKAPASVRTRIDPRVKEVRDAQKDFEASRAAVASLKDKPDDADANLALGKYLCFRKGDWDAGLPRLSKGGDAALKTLANADLGKPAGAEEQVKVGDGWWDLAKAKPELGTTPLQRRAAFWYQRAETGLQGLTRDRVQERQKLVLEQTPNLRPPDLQGELHRFDGHKDRVTCVAISKDGRRIVSGTQDGAVLLWDAALGKLIRPLTGITGDVRGVAMAPDGRHVAAASANGGWLWDVGDNDRAQRLTTLRAESVLFSPDSEDVTFAGDRGAIEAWTLSDRRPKQGSVSNPNWGIVRCLAGGPGGKLLFLVPSDGAVHVWDTRDGREIGKSMRGPAPLTSLASSPDGTELVAAWEKLAQVLHVKDGKFGPLFKGHTGRITGVAYSPDGRLVATSSDDRTVRIWDARTAQEVRRYTGHTEAVNCVVFSSDGRQLVSGSDDKTVRLWDVSKQ